MDIHYSLGSQSHCWLLSSPLEKNCICTFSISPTSALCCPALWLHFFITFPVFISFSHISLTFYKNITRNFPLQQIHIGKIFSNLLDVYDSLHHFFITGPFCSISLFFTRTHTLKLKYTAVAAFFFHRLIDN